MNKKVILLLLAINLLVAAGIIIYMESTRVKTYYIDLNKVYSEFTLKKDLEKRLEAMVSVTNEQLDSLEMNGRYINNSLQTSPSDQDKIREYNSVVERYATKSEEFDQQKKQVAAQYDDQIWSQLNEYIREYGKEHNCDFIIAGNGDGSIMYSTGSKDITDKMIVYVNGKYQGQ